jgi:hypothetical protein
VIVGLWIAAAALVVAAAAALVLRSSRPGASLPLADVGDLAPAVRRTWLRWAALVAALAAVLAVLAVRAQAGRDEAPILASGSNAVVVIDLSGSTRSASKAIARILSGLTRDGRRRLGLVVFSDTAYEALPAGTPVEGLQGWLRLFATDAPASYPWTPSFSSGTVISTGLVLARRMVLREPPQARHVVLVTDLIDAAPDLMRLEAVIASYQRERIDLRIVHVNRERGERSFGAFSYPNADFVRRAASLTVETAQPAKRRGEPLVLAGLVVLAALVLGGYELAFHPLDWKART